MSFADKATAFKHSVSGSSVNKSVCKASSHELAGPKKKHVDSECDKIDHTKCFQSNGVRRLGRVSLSLLDQNIGYGGYYQAEKTCS